MADESSKIKGRHRETKTNTTVDDGLGKEGMGGSEEKTKEEREKRKSGTGEQRACEQHFQLNNSVK